MTLPWMTCSLALERAGLPVGGVEYERRKRYKWSTTHCICAHVIHDAPFNVLHTEHSGSGTGPQDSQVPPGPPLSPRFCLHRLGIDPPHLANFGESGLSISVRHPGPTDYIAGIASVSKLAPKARGAECGVALSGESSGHCQMTDGGRRITSQVSRTCTPDFPRITDLHSTSP